MVTAATLSQRGRGKGQVSTIQALLADGSLTTGCKDIVNTQPPLAASDLEYEPLE